MTVARLINDKRGAVVSARTADKVADVVRTLAEKRIGCVPVVDGDSVVGIFSERDLVYGIAAHGPALLERTVAEVMTAPAVTIASDTPILTALSMMTRRRIRHLPVVDGGAMVAFISIGDLVKSRIDHIEAEAAAMRSYIQNA